MIWALERNAWVSAGRKGGLLLLMSDCGEFRVQKNGRDDSVSSLLQLRGDAKSTLLEELEVWRNSRDSKPPPSLDECSHLACDAREFALADLGSPGQSERGKRRRYARVGGPQDAVMQRFRGEWRRVDGI